MSRPNMLQWLRTLGRLQFRNADAPEDIETTLYVLNSSQDGVKTISEDIGL